MTDTPVDRLTAQAVPTLASIERRVSYILTNLRLAVGVLLNRPHNHTPPPIYASDLDAHAAHWRALVPKDDEGRAALLHVMAQKYALSQRLTPQVIAALGADSTAVQAEYERLYGEPIASAFRAKSDVEGHLLDSLHVVTAELEAADVSGALEWTLARRGDVLFREGDESDCLYVIVSGRLHVVVADEDGQETVVNELGRGDTVGEMGLVTGEPRSAIVRAARDTELCRFSKDAFEQLKREHPAVMSQIALQMIGRLRRLSRRDTAYNRPVTIAVLPASTGVRAMIARIASELEAHGATLHVSRAHLPDDVVRHLDARADESDFVAWLNSREMQHRFVIYEADGDDTHWTRRCILQADRVLIVARHDETPSLAAVETLRRMLKPGETVKTELLLIHPDKNTPLNDTRRWLSLCQPDQHYHVAEDSDNDVTRFLRFLRGTAVGVVLGAGGMRGSTHIGVIKALNELGIKADYIGGCSAGALIAAQYALGWDTDMMLGIGEQELVKNRALKDFTLPLVAFNSGKRLTQAFRAMLGETRIEDMWLPFFCVTSNLTTASLNIHREGAAWRYVRASTALPGVYPPVLDDNGDLLIDGSVFNSVPADVMRRFVDGGTVIAVDVGRDLSGKRDFRYGDHVNGWGLLLNRLKPFGKKARVPGIMRILTRSAALSGVHARDAQVASADLLLKPPIENFGLFDMDGYRDIYRIGYDYTLEKARTWQAEQAKG